jgi:hypothetical protein
MLAARGSREAAERSRRAREMLAERQRTAAAARQRLAALRAGAEARIEYSLARYLAQRSAGPATTRVHSPAR